MLSTANLRTSLRQSNTLSYKEDLQQKRGDKTYIFTCNLAFIEYFVLWLTMVRMVQVKDQFKGESANNGCKMILSQKAKQKTITIGKNISWQCYILLKMKYGEFGRPKLKDLRSSKGKYSLLNQFLSAKHSGKKQICFVLYLLSRLPFFL